MANKTVAAVQASGVPDWGQLSDVESRRLYRTEPPRKSLRVEEKYLLTFFRKLRPGARLGVLVLANNLALARIREKKHG